MNPVLLKPGSDRTQPGRRAGPAVAEVDALELPAAQGAAARGRRWTAWPAARPATTWSICEGAGSPAEINLRARRHRQHGPGPGRRAAGASWSATSTAAGCSPSLFGTVALLERRRPGAGRRLRGQQVPRRPRAARPRPRACCSGADRPAGPTACCPGWTGSGSTSRTPSPSAAARAGPPPTGRRRVLRRGGRPAAADLQLHRRRRAGRRAGRAGALRDRAGRRSWPTPTWWCCPAPGPRSPTWPGCGTRGWPRRCGGARPPAPGARHLRRLPDARPRTIPTTSSRGAGTVDGLGLLPATVDGSPRTRRCGRPAGTAYGHAGRRLRDPPRRRGPVASRAVDATASSTAAAPGPSGAPPGTAPLENDDFRRAFLADVAGRRRARLRARAGPSASPRSARPGWTPSATWSPTAPGHRRRAAAARRRRPRRAPLRPTGSPGPGGGRAPGRR